MKTTPWTEEREAQLKALWASGASCSKIAQLLGGTTRNAVIGKVTRMKLQPSRNRAHANTTRAQRRVSRGSKPVLVSPGLPVPVKPSPPPAPPATAIPFMQRRPFQCAWIIGEPSADALCCGAPVSLNAQLSFCAEHSDRSIQPEHRKRSRAA